MSYTALSINTFGVQIGDTRKTGGVNIKPDLENPLPFLRFQQELSPESKDNFLFIYIENTPSAFINNNIDRVVLRPIDKAGTTKEYSSSGIVATGDKIFKFIFRLDGERGNYNEVYNFQYELNITLNSGREETFMLRTVITPLFLLRQDSRYVDIDGNPSNFKNRLEDNFRSFEFNQILESNIDKEGLYGSIGQPSNKNSFNISSVANVDPEFLPLLTYPAAPKSTDIILLSDPTNSILNPKKPSINFAYQRGIAFAAFNTADVQDYYNSAEYGTINFSNKSPIHILTHTRYDIGTRSDRDDGSKGYQPPYVTFGSTENQQIFLSGNSTFAEEGSGDGDGYGDGTVDPVSPGQDPCNAVCLNTRLTKFV